MHTCHIKTICSVIWHHLASITVLEEPAACMFCAPEHEASRFDCNTRHRTNSENMWAWTLYYRTWNNVMCQILDREQMKRHPCMCTCTWRHTHTSARTHTHTHKHKHKQATKQIPQTFSQHSKNQMMSVMHSRLEFKILQVILHVFITAECQHFMWIFCCERWRTQIIFKRTKCLFLLNLGFFLFLCIVYCKHAIQHWSSTQLNTKYNSHTCTNCVLTFPVVSAPCPTHSQTVR